VAVSGLLALLFGAAQLLGTEGASCAGGGATIQATITGLRDRRGNLKLELFPATEADWLRDDRELLRERKVFRRVQVATPASGPVQLCIRAPQPGRYALFFTHDRDGRNKFNLWSDGLGVPGNARVGRARPQYSQAVVDVGPGGAVVTIRVQYLRGLGGFGPIAG
jgi:uncharacterized protein (DUF2141 family)